MYLIRAYLDLVLSKVIGPIYCWVKSYSLFRELLFIYVLNASWKIIKKSTVLGLATFEIYNFLPIMVTLNVQQIQQQ